MTVARSVLVWLVVAAWAAAAGGQEGVALVPRFAPGRYVLTAETNTYQYLTLRGKEKPEPPLAISRTLVLGLSAAGPDGTGKTRIDVSFRRIAQTISTRGREVAYDSNVKGGEYNRLRVLLAPLLKAKVTVVLDASGGVASVSGLDSLWDAQAKRNVSLRAWIKPMRVELGDAMIRRLFSLAHACRPSQPVRTGESWVRPMKYRLPLIGERKCSRTVTLKRVEKSRGGPVAVLKLLAQVKNAAPVRAQAEQLPLTVREASVTHTGTIRIAADTGLPLETDILLRSILEVSGRHPKRGAFTRQLDHKLTEKITIRPDTAPTTRPAGKDKGASKGP